MEDGDSRIVNFLNVMDVCIYNTKKLISYQLKKNEKIMNFITVEMEKNSEKYDIKNLKDTLNDLFIKLDKQQSNKVNGI